jgi:hypothetical protein
MLFKYIASLFYVEGHQYLFDKCVLIFSDMNLKPTMKSGLNQSIVGYAVVCLNMLLKPFILHMII